MEEQNKPQTTQEEQTQLSPSTKHTRYKWVYILIAIVLLLLIAVGIYVLHGRNSKKLESNKKTSLQPSPTITVGAKQPNSFISVTPSGPQNNNHGVTSGKLDAVSRDGTYDALVNWNNIWNNKTQTMTGSKVDIYLIKLANNTKKLLYSNTINGAGVYIHQDNWSLDDNYFWTSVGDQTLLFKGDGSTFANNVQYVDITSLFQKQTGQPLTTAETYWKTTDGLFLNTEKQQYIFDANTLTFSKTTSSPSNFQ